MKDSKVDEKTDKYDKQWQALCEHKIFLAFGFEELDAAQNETDD